MALEKMKIKAKDSEFTVMVNPESYSAKESVKYTHEAEERSPKFERYEGTKFTIPKIFLDTTGAIPSDQWPIKDGSINDMVEALRNIVYEIDGDAHEPSVVEITWGSQYYTGRLRTMDTKYTLFDLQGAPLRAEITLEFVSYSTLKEIQAKSNFQSPDLTHIIEVKSGDTLPNLCNKVYNDPSYYMQVARINGLSSFCRLKPGTRLVFPPLVD
jgi:LysM repeat protein